MIRGFLTDRGRSRFRCMGMRSIWNTSERISTTTSSVGTSSGVGELRRLRSNPSKSLVEVEGILFEPLPVFHGKMEIYGYRFGSIAYISDVSYITQATLDRLQDLGCLIVDAMPFRPHSTHFNIEQALNVVRIVQPGQTLQISTVFPSYSCLYRIFILVLLQIGQVPRPLLTFS